MNASVEGVSGLLIADSVSVSVSAEGSALESRSCLTSADFDSLPSLPREDFVNERDSKADPAETRLEGLGLGRPP